MLLLKCYLKMLYAVFQRRVQHLREGRQGREPRWEVRQHRQLRRVGPHVQYAQSCHHSGKTFDYALTTRVRVLWLQDLWVQGLWVWFLPVLQKYKNLYLCQCEFGKFGNIKPSHDCKHSKFSASLARVG